MAGYRRLNQTIGNEDQVEGGYQQVNVQTFDVVARDAQDIRRSHISFQSYLRGGTLGAEAFQFVRDYQSHMSEAGTEKVAQFMTKQIPQCCSFLSSVLSKIRMEEPLRYAVTLLNDVLEDDSIRDPLLKELDIFEVVRCLVSQLKSSDRYIMLMAGLSLGRIVLHGNPHHKLSQEDSVVFLRWMVQQLTALDSDYLVCLTESLKMFLRLPHYRDAFFDANGLKPLTDILSRKINFQLQYQVCFCLWMLSFNANLVERMKDSLVVMVTADTLRATTREKVRRVIFAFYRNLIEKSPSHLAEHFAIQMVTYKVLLVLNILVKNTYQDEDFSADVEFLQDHLSNSVNEMSSFDEFSAELKSKRLEWSPVHKSDKFWRENVQRLHDNNYQLLK
jgi:V-type H+-transporting ATPase subunit H